MPQLPSGLHFGLDTLPLKQVIDDACDGCSVHTLMAITELHHLFAHVGIVYFRPKSTQVAAERFHRNSEILPEDLEPFPSGYDLITIKDEYTKWSGEDQAAFIAFLSSPRVEAYFAEALDVVRQNQQYLLGHPSSLPGLQATWWKHGCHPLQEPLDD